MAQQKISRYEIKAELGRGGMATLYHAHDPNFERDVAIKVLPHEFLHDPTFLQRFEREARVIARLEHAAIVPVYDFGEYEGQPFLVMRYMVGGSLAERIARGPLPLPVIARIVGRLAPALDKVHSKGIIHRDLKPGNILLDEDGEAYISDFGIAKLVESTLSLTGGSIIGTPAYLSPEQAEGRGDLDGRSDLYSLGVIVFQMLTGQLPYKSDTPVGFISSHLYKPVPNVLEFNPALPPACKGIIERAMAKDAADRYPSACEMAADLNAAAQGEQGAQRTVPLQTEVQTMDLVRPSAEADWQSTLGTLPQPLAEALLTENAYMRSLAVADAIRQMATSPHADALRAALAHLAEHDPDEQVRATAGSFFAEERTLRQNEAITPPGEAQPIRPTIGHDPILDVLPPPFEWCGIPAGRVTLADGAGTFDMAAFAMAKYPITYAQFQVFIEEQDGFRNPEWWEGLAADANHRKRPGNQWWKIADHPRETVCWYDAVAFTRWLTRKVGYAVRLPTEWEWQWSAQGSDGREYPWGNEFDGDRCNFNSGGTTPVTWYSGGESPFQVMDMAGNVWEWCLNEYHTPGRVEPGGNAARVVRGGSWSDGKDGARAASRSAYDPGIRVYLCGFRVCVPARLEG